jgi:hypothetical protein
MDTLAAAYAETGDFQSVVRWQKKAIELNGSRDGADRQSLESRLAMYQNGQLYRDVVSDD